MEDDATNEDLQAILFPGKYAYASPYTMPDFAHMHLQLARSGVSLSLLWEEYCAAVRDAGGVPYIKLQLFDTMNNEEIEKLKENIKHVNIWKITVDPAFKEDDPAEGKASAGSYKKLPIDPNLPFEVKSSVKDGVFEAFIQGRMDTITAPELLKRFQEAGQGLTSIHIDVSRMAYVSSAGLRVLLMMYKSLKDKSRFELTGVNAEVREILEMTGFDQFLL